MASPQKKIKVAVLFGGRSGEHEVSLVSAASVIGALDKSKYEIVPIGITKEGRWIASHDAMQLLKSGDIPPALKSLMPPDPALHEIITIEEGSRDEKLQISTAKAGSRSGGAYYKLQTSQIIDVAFPVLHGTFGEDGTVQGLLEMAGIPYVGPGVLGSAIGMDKAIQKDIFRQAGLLTPNSVTIHYPEEQEWDDIIRHIEKSLSYPLFIKPANLGSSVGISKVHDAHELLPALKLARTYDVKIIVEQAVASPREIEISVLGYKMIEASVPGEIVPSNEFYDYNAKYVDGKSKSVIPAPIPPSVAATARENAIRAFKAIDGWGMARCDFLLDPEGRLFINEINTIPGFTSISMYPKLWEASGLSYPALLDRLIDIARARAADQAALKRTFETNDWYK
jgi:D-alanine-D-alanine ligase